MADNLLKRFDSLQEENLIFQNLPSEMLYLKSTMSGIEIIANGVKKLINDIKIMSHEMSKKTIHNVTHCVADLEESFLQESMNVEKELIQCVLKNRALE